MKRKQKQKLPWYKKLFSSRRRIVSVALAAIFLISAVVIAQRVEEDPLTETLDPRLFANDPITPNPTLSADRCKRGLNLALVLDMSGSTVDTTPNIADQAAILVNALDGGNGRLKDGIRASVVWFAGTGGTAQELTNNTASLISAIRNPRSMSLEDGTSWPKGIEAGQRSLSGVPGTPRLLIMLSDGQTNASMGPPHYAANAVKGSGARIMSALVDLPFLHRRSEGLLNAKFITNGVSSTVNTGILPDVIFANERAITGELQRFAHRICDGGGNGNGIGNNGVGVGNNGVGVGNAGVGRGRSPQSPNPNPTPSPSPSATDTNTQDNPAPTPKGQGITVTPPPDPPSPFFDGIQYTKASEIMNFASSSSRSRTLLWIGGIVIIIAIPALTGWFILHRKPASRNSDKYPKK